MAFAISSCTFPLLSRAACPKPRQRRHVHSLVPLCDAVRRHAGVDVNKKRIQSNARSYVWMHCVLKTGCRTQKKKKHLAVEQSASDEAQTENLGVWRVCVRVLPCVYNVRLSVFQLCDEESGYNPARGTTHWPACQHVPPSSSRLRCVCVCVYTL